MTENASGVSLTTDGAVGIVTFSRPPQNYFDLPMIEALAEALERVDRMPELRTVLLCSDGKTFCAGARFTGEEGTGGGTLSDPTDLYRAAACLFRTRKPIVVAVQGAAVGGGLGLAMVGDFRVAAETARFSANFVKLGIHPGFGLTVVLPRVVGYQQAAMLLYSGRRIDGHEALRIGLVDACVGSGVLIEASLALAKELAEGSPLALEATRATLRAGYANAVSQQLEHEIREQKTLFLTKDFKEGVQAVAERRPAVWTRE
jgi:enoyl-CoA hydratase/carnithine racemase